MSNQEQKAFNLNQLRKAYVEFMQVVASMPGAPIQKQQAFYRFDEGHMWMQNAVLTYVEPGAPVNDAANEAQAVEVQAEPIEQQAEQAPSEPSA